MKVSTRVRAYGVEGAAPTEPPPRVRCAGLADELVLPVRLDLEDVELRVQRVVRLRREAERAAEDPGVDADALDLPQDRPAICQRAVPGDAGLLDRPQHHLNGPVRRRADGAECRLRVVLLRAGED